MSSIMIGLWSLLISVLLACWVISLLNLKHPLLKWNSSCFDWCLDKEFNCLECYFGFIKNQFVIIVINLRPYANVQRY